MRKFSRKDTWWTRWLNEWWRWCVCAGTPVNRIPIMAKQTLDLYELFRLVVSKGGLVEVINKKLWREITKGLNLPSSITSAAFTLRTQSVPSRRSSSKTLKLNEWPRWIIVLSGLGRHLDKAIWRQNRSNTISGFAFVDIAAFRRSKSMSKPNFVDIIISIDGWDITTSVFEKQTSALLWATISVCGRPCYILPMLLFIYLFLWPPYFRPCWTEVRESFTRAGPWVSLEKLLLLGFFPGHP